MNKRQLNIFRYVRVITVAVFLCLICGGYFYSRLVDKTYGFENGVQPTPTPRSKNKAVPLPKTSKYANFQHNTHTKLKLACNSCHKLPTENWKKVRSKETAFPDVTDYPKHESCLKCHQQQFFSGKPPAICANCHTNPSPNNSSRHPFANPREVFDASPKGKNASSVFEISFPHDKHIEIVSRNENRFEPKQNGVKFIKAGMRLAGEESCAVCHQTANPQDKSDVEFLTTPPKDLGDAFWLKKGTFKTGPPNHSTCFTCHSAETGILPAQTDCASCHQLKQTSAEADFDAKLAEKIGITDKETLLDWKRRDSSGTFRHEFSSHADMDCASCHNVAAMKTADAKTKKVQILSCSPCHITATSDDGGILNYEIDSKKKDAKFECVKCHLSFGKMQVPESHTKAIESLK